MRNPWRFSFDRTTGDLWIADVGQDKYEEIDFMPAGPGRRAPTTAGTGSKGNHPYQGVAPANAVAPVVELSHTNGYCAVVGGFVYRGSKIPDLRGSYLYSDNCNPKISAIRVEGGRVDDVTRPRCHREVGVVVRPGRRRRALRAVTE